MEIELEQVPADIRDRLLAGASDRNSALHTPVVVTGDGDARVMVLRHFDPAHHTLRFHTDARSPKVRAIEENPQVTVLCYDREAKLQLRIKGHGRIEHNGAIAKRAWAESTNFAKRCYLAEQAPGATSDKPTSGLPEWVEGIKPSDEQVAPGRDNFAVLIVEMREIDWFYLANSGHRRALVTIGDDHDNPKMSWISP